MTPGIGVGTGTAFGRKKRSGIPDPEPWAPTNTEVVAYTGGLVTPLSEAHTQLIDTFVSSLKTGLSISALSDAFDVMYILAGETAESSLRNLVKRAHDAEAVNSPTFTPYEGWAGDGISSYIDIHYNIATQAVNFTLNEAAYGCYLRSDIKSTTYDMGGYRNTSNRNYISTRNAADRYTCGVQGASYSTLGSLDSRGLHIACRIDDLNVGISKNGADLVIGASAASVVNYDNPNYLLCYSDGNGTPTGFSQRQMAMAFYSKKVSNANCLTIKNTFEALMDANGKGVID